MRSSILFVALVLMCGLANGQSTAESSCNALLTHGIANTTEYTTDQSFLSVVKDQYCSSTYDSLTSSKKASFEAVVKAIPIGISGSSAKTSERHEAFCRNYDGLHRYQDSSRYSASALYDKAITAWNDCIRLALGGINVRPTVHADQAAIDFEMSASIGASVFRGVDGKNVECTIDGKPVSGSERIELSSRVTSMQCTRTHKPIQFSGSTMEYYPPAHVKVKTESGDYLVELLERMTGVGADRLSRLETQLASLDTLIRSIGRDGSVKSTTIMGPGAPNKLPTQAPCDEGSFVSGVDIASITWAKYSFNSVATIKVDCKPFIAE